MGDDTFKYSGAVRHKPTNVEHLSTSSVSLLLWAPPTQCAAHKSRIITERAHNFAALNLELEVATQLSCWQTQICPHYSELRTHVFCVFCGSKRSTFLLLPSCSDSFWHCVFQGPKHDDEDDQHRGRKLWSTSSEGICGGHGCGALWSRTILEIKSQGSLYNNKKQQWWEHYLAMETTYGEIGTVDVASGWGHAKQVPRPPASVSTLKTPHLSISSGTWGSCLTKFLLSTLAPTPKPQCQEAKALNLEHWR